MVYFPRFGHGRNVHQRKWKAILRCHCTFVVVRASAEDVVFVRIFKKAVTMTVVAAATLTLPVLAANPAAADGGYLPYSRCVVIDGPLDYPGTVDSTGTYCETDPPTLIPRYEYLGTSPACGTLIVGLLTVIDVRCLAVFDVPPARRASTP